MNLLLIDDEEDAVVDHIEALRSVGHRIDWVSTLGEALERLRASFDASEKGRYDIVMIDLWLDALVPPELKAFYDGLQPGQGNEGQALGQWLWETEGARAKNHRPMHFYFTNLPHLYRRHRDPSKQEFALQKAHTAPGDPWVLLKWDVVPSKFGAKLADVEKVWRGLPRP